MTDFETNINHRHTDHVPEELQGPQPREVPDSVREGRIARGYRKTFWPLVATGAFCLLVSPLPFMKLLSLYLLPLAWVDWIGAGLIVIAVLNNALPIKLNRARRYIIEGDAALGTVKTILKFPVFVQNGVPAQYAFKVTTEVVHPDTGEPVIRDMQSEGFSSAVKDSIDTRFRVGDRVPVVWLPGRFEKSLQIYDFLEVMPHSDLLRLNEGQPTPIWKTVSLVMLGPLFFFALMWSIYAMGRYLPIEFNDNVSMAWIPLSLGAVLGVGAFVLVVWCVGVKKNVDESNRKAMADGSAIEVEPTTGAAAVVSGLFLGGILVFGAGLLGALTTACMATTLNALLDDSAAVAVSVEITGAVEVTHNFIFREYKLEYKLEGTELSLLSTPQHLMQFAAPHGTAQVRQGWLGWRWVETVDPPVLP